MPTRDSRLACPGIPLSRRVLHHEAGWRSPIASNRSIPKFYVHECPACLSKATRDSLRHQLAGKAAEELLPNDWSMHLVDTPIMEALLTHPDRITDPTAAEWHVVDATPYTSFVLAELGLMGGRPGHVSRMRELAVSLTASRYWRPRAPWKQAKPFLLLQPYIDPYSVLGGELSSILVRRSSEIGRTVIATIDRSAASILPRSPIRSQLKELLLRAIEIPYAASPELARWASDQVLSERQPWTQEQSGLSVAAAVRRAGRPRDKMRLRTPAAQRSGFLFHGDTGRFDQGIRGAMRDMIPHLAAPTSFASRVLHRGVNATENATEHSSKTKVPRRGRGGQLVMSSLHAAFREVSMHTSQEMLRTSMCFVPQGDTMSSRRMFDALASGCLPIVLKCLGNSRTELVLGNLPFHHTINWQAISLFLVPRSTRSSDREIKATGARAVCRVEEAEWINSFYDNHRAIASMRREAIEAFHAHMNVWLRPSGVADALLREAAFILDELPHRSLLSKGRIAPSDYMLNQHYPPPHLLRQPATEGQEMALPLAERSWEVSGNYRGRPPTG